LSKSIVGAASGLGIGVMVALFLFWSGPHIVEWIKGPPRLAAEAWVFYVLVICGAGFGSVTGAIIGATASRNE